MTFYTIRLKQKPDLYIGKTNSTYALLTDQGINDQVEWYKNTRNQDATPIQILFFFDESKPPQWYVPEARAKVWTTIKSIKNFTSYAKCKERNNTFNEYEIVVNESGVIPLDKFLQDNA